MRVSYGLLLEAGMTVFHFFLLTIDEGKLWITKSLGKTAWQSLHCFRTASFVLESLEQALEQATCVKISDELLMRLLFWEKVFYLLSKCSAAKKCGFLYTNH